MKALVTGGNGFIGSVLVEKLLQQGIATRCLVRETSNLRWIKNLNVEFVYGELSRPETLEQAAQGVDYIFHLAGSTRGLTEADYMNGNYTATLNVLQAAQQHCPELKKFIFVSSQAAAGPSQVDRASTEEDVASPVSAYGRSKLAAENKVREFNEFFPTTIIRPPSVYGPRDKDFYILFQNAVKGIIPIAGNAEQKISIVYVDDLVDGILLAAESSLTETFFITGDQDCTWLELANLIHETINKKSFTFIIPVFAVKFALIFAKFYSRISRKAILLNEDKVNEMVQTSWLCSNAKAKKLLGYSPKINLQQGVKKTAEWYRANKWI